MMLGSGTVVTGTLDWCGYQSGLHVAKTWIQLAETIMA